MMNTDQAWDIVLPLEHDIARIVSQAVSLNRVRADYTTTDGMSYIVELLVSTVELITDPVAFGLASLRRELRYKDSKHTDVLERGQVKNSITTINEQLDGDEDDSNDTTTDGKRRGEQKANRAKGAARPLSAMLACLSPLEKRVVSLKTAGMTVWRIGRRCGMRQNAVQRVLGQAASKIRSSNTTAEIGEQMANARLRKPENGV